MKVLNIWDMLSCSCLSTCCCCSIMAFKHLCLLIWMVCNLSFSYFFKSNSSPFSAISWSALSFRYSTAALPFIRLFFARALPSSEFIFCVSPIVSIVFPAHPLPSSCLSLVSLCFHHLVLVVQSQQIPPLLWSARWQHPALFAQVLSHSLSMLVLVVS